ncbi:MAG: hypothetical protein IBX72_05355 [Nitrospirae bacterium]|nr:hypothetical protein [Nitrospirota bacterium]
MIEIFTIVDDIVTTGKSSIEAINRAREEGLEIVKVIALISILLRSPQSRVKCISQTFSNQIIA